MGRQRYAGTIFALVVDEEASYWLFWYAKQSPYRLYFLRLSLEDGICKDFEPASFTEAFQACAAEPVWSFQRATTTVTLDYDLPMVAPDMVFVLPQIAFHRPQELRLLCVMGYLSPSVSHCGAQGGAIAGGRIVALQCQSVAKGKP